jgi:hypothetical protein
MTLVKFSLLGLVYLTLVVLGFMVAALATVV